MFCVPGSQVHGNYSKINISLDAEFLSSLFTFLFHLVKILQMFLSMLCPVLEVSFGLRQEESMTFS